MGPHHPDKATGSARLPQVPQVNTGGSGPQHPCPPLPLINCKLFVWLAGCLSWHQLQKSCSRPYLMFINLLAPTSVFIKVFKHGICLSDYKAIKIHCQIDMKLESPQGVQISSKVPCSNWKTVPLEGVCQKHFCPHRNLRKLIHKILFKKVDKKDLTVL